MLYRPFLTSFLSALFLISCNEPRESSSQADSLTAIVSDTIASATNNGDTLVMESFLQIGSELSPVVMREKARLYASVDASSLVKKELALFTPVGILERGGIYTKDSSSLTLKQGWFKIEVQGDTGYVRSQDVCYFHLENPKGNCHYLISLNEAAEYEIMVYKYGLAENKLLDSQSVYLGGSDSQFLPDIVRLKDDITLKNVSGMIDIYRVDEYCGGGSHNNYVLDLNDSLSLFMSVGGGGELCDGSSTQVFFPYTKNGDTIPAAETVNRVALTKEVTALLKDPKISTSQLLIKNSYEQTGIYPENKEETDCTYKVTTDLSEIHYWNGEKLVLLKVVNYLK